MKAGIQPHLKKTQHDQLYVFNSRRYRNVFGKLETQTGFYVHMGKRALPTPRLSRRPVFLAVLNAGFFQELNGDNLAVEDMNAPSPPTYSREKMTITA